MGKEMKEGMLKADAKKIAEGYSKHSIRLATELEAGLRRDFAMGLQTFKCIKLEHVVVITKRDVWIGRLWAVDPTHINLLLLDAESMVTGARAQKVFVRGDMVELIIHCPNRVVAEATAERFRRSEL